MARDLKTADVAPFFNALRVMYNSANQGANATTLSVNELRRLIDLIHNNFNLMKGSWQRLRDRIGADEARNIIATSLDPTPADLGAAVAAVQSSAISLLSSYEASAYGTGSPAFTYSRTLTNGLFTGGHVEINVASGTLTAIKASFDTLRTDLLVIAPVE